LVHCYLESKQSKYDLSCASALPNETKIEEIVLFHSNAVYATLLMPGFINTE